MLAISQKQKLFFFLYYLFLSYCPIPCSSNTSHVLLSILYVLVLSLRGAILTISAHNLIKVLHEQSLLLENPKQWK